MKQCGVITQVKDTTAKVLMQRHSACGSCKGCRLGQEDMKMEIEAINGIHADVGQWVEVNMEEQNVLLAAFIAYVIPLLSLVVGILLATVVLSSIIFRGNIEVYAALTGLVFMFGSYYGIRKKENKFRNNRKFLPVIMAIITNEEKI